ncbi:MAG: FxsA family protein, partial [Methylophilaceae bacterium]
VVVAYLGLQLIRGEKLLISAKMIQSLGVGGNPIKTILGSARNMLAGVLLVIPGVMTDVIAAVLLLIPIQQTKLNTGRSHHPHYETNFDAHYRKSDYAKNNSQAANDDVIEGEYVEIKEQPTNIGKSSTKEAPEKK